MVRHTKQGLRTRFLYIHTFPLLYPGRLNDFQRFVERYPSPDLITSVADKLRWYRYKKTLHQRDVADYVGLDRSLYIHYESGERQHFPIKHMTKIAELFEVDITELLDDYNLFLYRGQGKQIKAIRKQLKLTQQQFASKMRVATGTVKKWEQDRVRISKESWTKISLLST